MKKRQTSEKMQKALSRFVNKRMSIDYKKRKTYETRDYSFSVKKSEPQKIAREGVSVTWQVKHKPTGKRETITHHNYRGFSFYETKRKKR